MDINTILALSAESPQEIYFQKGDVCVTITPAPSHKKLVDAAQQSLNMMITDSPVISAAVYQMALNLGIIRAFTNIPLKFADEDETYKLYDALVYTGILAEVKDRVNPDAKNFFIVSVRDTLKDILNYKRSAAGIVDSIAASADSNIAVMNEAENILSDESKMEKVLGLLQVQQQLSSPIAE